MKGKKLFIPFLIAAIAIGIISFGIYQHQQGCEHCFSLKSFTPEVVKHYIEGFGPWAVVVFILLYTVNTISLLPPIAIMTLSAAVLFEPLTAFASVMAGATLGTTSTFFISRFFGGKFIEGLTKSKKAKEFQENLGKNGFIVILPIRLIGFPPWELVNYVSGLSRISYRDYISATIIGIIPATAIQIFFVDRLTNFDPKDPTLYMAVGAFILLAVVPTLIINARKKSAKGGSASGGRNEGTA